MSTRILSILILLFLRPGLRGEFYQDLRDARPLDQGLSLTGPYLAKYTFREREGLRVLLPPRRERIGPIGLQTNFTVRGDFEITGTYEILAVDQPVGRANHAGVDLWIRLGNDEKRHARLGRFLSSREGHAYVVQHTDRNLPRPTRSHLVATEVLQGKLRLSRHGTTLRYSVLDATTEGMFRELMQAEFGKEDITRARFGVSTDNEFLGLEGRLIDLRIQGEGVPDTASEAREPDRPAGRKWTLIALGIVLAIALVFGGAGVARWLLGNRGLPEQPT